MKTNTALLLLLVSTSLASAQRLEIHHVKGAKFNIPPAAPLPVAYRAYHTVYALDSIASFLTGSPFSRNHLQLFIENLENVKLIRSRELVKQKGQFYIKLTSGAFKIISTKNIPRPKKTNSSSTGYVKEIRYSLPFWLTIHYPDSVKESAIYADSKTHTYIYDPNFGKLRGGDLWNVDEVFTSEEELEEVFENEKRLVYNEIIRDLFRYTILRKVRGLTEALYDGYQNVSYAPRFYTAKLKGRQFNYSDLDTAYTAYVEAFTKLRQEPANPESYRRDFEKALNICLEAYNSGNPRMSFEIKNGMLYNIATIYYHIGNLQEARKYKDLYLVDPFNYISKQNPYYEPAYEKWDVHFVLYETYWGNHY